jgi:hypothetical protein
MAGFFYKLGRMLGPKVRQANWMVSSLTGTEAEAIHAEEQVGRDLAQSFLQQMDVEEDPAVLAVIQEVGSRLVSCVKGKDRAFRFVVGRSRELNAYALPGGFIFLHPWPRDGTRPQKARSQSLDGQLDHPHRHGPPAGGRGAGGADSQHGGHAA